MANEIRKRSNFLSGTITNNPLAAGGTTLNAAALADLEVISSTEHALVILDPLGEGSGPDLAYITAHTSAAISATIARSKEGTTGVEHATGTKFLIGPVESDFVMAKPGAELPSTPYYAGQLVVDTDGPTLKMGKPDLSGWHAMTPTAGTFTPQLYQNGNITSSTAVGRYFTLGKWCFLHIRNVASAAGSAGNAVAIASIPSALAPLKTGQPNGLGDTSGVGPGYVLDTGSQYYPAHAYFASSTTIHFYGVDVTTGLNIGVTPSFAIASGDCVGVDLIYELA